LVENEFGDVAIDTKLIKGVDASQMFELKEGCICCTITDEFELVLQELAVRFPNVESLLIETTGVAEPASVIRPFFSDEDLKKLYSYNGTICVVDAINFETQPEKEISIKQIVAADLVLINKTEKVSIEESNDLKNEIEQINPFCNIQFTLKSNLADDLKLNQILQKERSVFDFPRIHSEHLKLETKTITFETPLKKKDFTEWLSYNLDVYKNQIYRVKGLLCFENEPFEYILQGVGGSFEISESECFADLLSESKIVLIGKLKSVEIDKEMIRKL
jgi:G3E family GTPase